MYVTAVKIITLMIVENTMRQQINTNSDPDAEMLRTHPLILAIYILGLVLITLVTGGLFLLITYLFKLKLFASPMSKKRAHFIKFFSTNHGHTSYSKDSMAMVVATKKASRAKKGLPFNCLVVSRYNFIEDEPTQFNCELTDLFKDLNKKMNKSQAEFRFQVLYQNFGHWSTLDIAFKAGQLSFYLIDSIKTESSLTSVLPLIASILPRAHLNYTGGPFQYDMGSCGVFAFDSASCLARIPDLHEQLTRLENTPFPQTGKVMGISIGQPHSFKYIAPEQLSGDLAPLLRNIQSFETLKEYCALNPSLETSKGSYRHKRTLKEKIEQHTRKGKTITKSHNYSVYDKNVSMKKKTLVFLKALTEADFGLFLSQRKLLPDEMPANAELASVSEQHREAHATHQRIG